MLNKVLILIVFVIIAVFAMTMIVSDIAFKDWFDYSYLVLINEALDRKIVKSFFIVLIGAFLLLVLIIAMIYKPKSFNRFGNARFARPFEINKYGYNAKNGIILGQTKHNKLLISNGPKTVGLSAKPRSGKGVSMVIPNLLNWDGSVICVDIKKELYEITSGFRGANGQKIICFDPMDKDMKSDCINIFDDVSDDENRRIADVQRIAKAIIPTKDPFWDSGGRLVFNAIALYLLETKQNTSFGSIYRFANDGVNLQDKFHSILQNKLSDTLTRQCKGLLFEFSDIENEKVAGGFLGTFNSRMEMFSNPLISASTDKTSEGFNFASLREDKVTIYLVARPEHISILGRLFGLITETIIFALTRHEPKKGETGKVLFMFDEFTALGAMDRVKKGSAYFGGYGIRLVMIYQNEAQLQDVYGTTGARELTSLIHERVVFAPSDIIEASNISKELGTFTVKVKNTSVSRGGRSHSYSEASKSLMTPENIMLMPNSDEIILSTEQRPIYCKKITYYNDKRFTARLLPHYKDVPKLEIKDYIFTDIQIIKREGNKEMTEAQAEEELDNKVF